MYFSAKSLFTLFLGGEKIASVKVDETTNDEVTTPLKQNHGTEVHPINKIVLASPKFVATDYTNEIQIFFLTDCTDFHRINTLIFNFVFY